MLIIGRVFLMILRNKVLSSVLLIELILLVIEILLMM